MSEIAGVILDLLEENVAEEEIADVRGNAKKLLAAFSLKTYAIA